MHLSFKRGFNEKCNIHRGCLYLFSNICGSVIAYLDQITNLEILPYQIFCRITYVTGCYSLTLPLSEDWHVAKSLQDIGL